MFPWAAVDILRSPSLPPPYHTLPFFTLYIIVFFLSFFPFLLFFSSFLHFYSLYIPSYLSFLCFLNFLPLSSGFGFLFSFLHASIFLSFLFLIDYSKFFSFMSSFPHSFFSASLPTFFVASLLPSFFFLPSIVLPFILEDFFHLLLPLSTFLFLHLVFSVFTPIFLHSSVRKPSFNICLIIFFNIYIYIYIYIYICIYVRLLYYYIPQCLQFTSWISQSTVLAGIKVYNHPSSFKVTLEISWDFCCLAYFTC